MQLKKGKSSQENYVQELIKKKLLSKDSLKRMNLGKSSTTVLTGRSIGQDKK